MEATAQSAPRSVGLRLLLAPAVSVSLTSRSVRPHLRLRACTARSPARGAGTRTRWSSTRSRRRAPGRLEGRSRAAPGRGPPGAASGAGCPADPGPYCARTGTRSSRAPRLRPSFARTASLRGAWFQATAAQVDGGCARSSHRLLNTSSRVGNASAEDGSASAQPMPPSGKTMETPFRGRASL